MNYHHIYIVFSSLVIFKRYCPHDTFRKENYCVKYRDQDLEFLNGTLHKNRLWWGKN